MCQLALFQLTVECPPLLVQLGGQGIKLCFNRLAQEWDVHLCQLLSVLFHRHQLIGEMPMLQTVIEIKLARLETLCDLVVQPELVAVGM